MAEESVQLIRSPLEPMLLRAGAAMAARHGWLVAAHFGSPPGEISVCETAVGLADRSDLGKFQLRAPAGDLDMLVGQLSGGEIRPGDALARRRRLVVLGLARARAGGVRRGRHGAAARRARRGRALGAGRHGRRQHGGARRASACSGPPTSALLEELRGSEPAFAEDSTPELEVTRLAAVPAMVLRKSRDRALILTERARAGELWNDIERAGDSLGLGHVGAEAVDRVPLAHR